MTESQLAAAVTEALGIDATTFQRRAAEDADVIIEALSEGVFDNPQAIVGFEYEFYAVDGETSALRRVPRRMLEYIGFEKELGLHNAEMSTSPQPLNAHGLRAQEAEIKARLTTALECVRPEGITLVSDGMWTIPPEGEGSREYLTDHITDGGIRIATNMSDSVRYHAMANAEGETTAGMHLDAPNVTLDSATVMPESLITSIQPHYQVAHAADLPDYFNYALRIAGPLLALGANSPFFPPALYDDVPDERVVDEAWMTNRIPVFESVLNEGTPGKVRFPHDLQSVEEAVDRVVADEIIVPMPVETSDRFDDEFAHFRMKHGTYWRWVRPVFDGSTRSAANARIEFRPIGSQPTVRDSVSFLAVFAGLLESLPRREHPVIGLDWADARENFYAAMRDGLGADLSWITGGGEETIDGERLFADLFDHARDGLKLRGLSDQEVETYLWPLRHRARHGYSPAEWRHERVADLVEEGTSLSGAIETAQREYIDRQKETLLEGSFADWVDDR
ncbi:hypothetical protein [Halalkalicoccus tibetensis]|uniref:Glutamate--cysteine ligase n=1 Tax=Halalkalicoccus tibetensis TaxID=175632 RepID=A0ABD5VAB3_9EURY